jgi:uncharacterized membrane protein
MTDRFFKNQDDKAGRPEIPDLENAENFGADRTTYDKDRGVIAAVLAYIPFLCLIPLIQMRDNEQARFHSRQGFLLFLIELLAILFLIPGISGMVWKAVLILALGAAVAGIVFGIQGKKYRLPIIGDFADKMKI